MFPLCFFFFGFGFRFGSLHSFLYFILEHLGIVRRLLELAGYLLHLFGIDFDDKGTVRGVLATSVHLASSYGKEELVGKEEVSSGFLGFFVRMARILPWLPIA